ncbi:hypothetical protein HOY80DRAFT_996406 [Tuber brumale]|nr:hypothetical protein HOY80DRAFT_996406 [Tuber brumale]
MAPRRPGLFAKLVHTALAASAAGMSYSPFGCSWANYGGVGLNKCKRPEIKDRRAQPHPSNKFKIPSDIAVQRGK